MESTACFGVFSDNGFHMRPTIPVDISFKSFTATDVSSFKAGLTIRQVIIIANWQGVISYQMNLQSWIG